MQQWRLLCDQMKERKQHTDVSNNSVAYKYLLTDFSSLKTALNIILKCYPAIAWTFTILDPFNR